MLADAFREVVRNDRSGMRLKKQSEYIHSFRSTGEKGYVYSLCYWMSVMLALSVLEVLRIGESVQQRASHLVNLQLVEILLTQLFGVNVFREI